MLYRGKEIADRCYVEREQTLSYCYPNSQEFDLDEIEAWKEAINDKTEELKGEGVDFQHVRLRIIGDGYHYNLNGADDDEYMKISLVWIELETDEEMEKRIENRKRLIDMEIAEEKEREEVEKIKKENEIWKAIETLRSNGYNVS